MFTVIQSLVLNPDPAISANSLMNTDCTATTMAGPFPLLVFHKKADPGLFYHHQIFNHAHFVFGPVSCIQLYQSFTGKFRTIKTKVRAGFITIFNPACSPGDRFALIRASASGAFIFLPQMNHADAAIHPACCNQYFFIHGLHFAISAD